MSIGDLSNSSFVDDDFLDDAYLVSHNELRVSTCRPQFLIFW